MKWGRHYTRRSFGNDAMAALVVTIMLIPQSLAYAMLAGLPPEAGLYASILPILIYAALGTSPALAVGPVAVISLLTASAIGQVAAQGTAGYAAAALTLALLSGAILVGMGLMRLGFLANVLSHPVIAGFISASGILIAAGQIQHLLGITAGGQALPAIAAALLRGIGGTSLVTLAIGLFATGFLIWVRRGLRPALKRAGLSAATAGMIQKAGPVVAVAVTTVAAWGLDLARHGVQVVGAVPKSLPPLTMPDLSPDLVRALLLPALMLSVIGFVESVSVAQTLAARRRQRIDPDQELVGLGAANIGAAFTGGLPVTGGFARSVVNADAGAETPAAGAMTAIGIAVAALALTPLLFICPWPHSPPPSSSRC